MLWNLAPIGVTLISFFWRVEATTPLVHAAMADEHSYIVIEKKELTVSVAFTAINLFNMLRTPLNVIPTFVSPTMTTAITHDCTLINRSSSFCNRTFLSSESRTS